MTCSRSWVALWLLLTTLLVLSMIILGATVRLTGSGLSMVQWQPLLGVIPPLDTVQWQAAFALYQNYPEYELINHQMTLGEFKFIYLMEYAHRVLGRLVGVVFGVPLLIMWWLGCLGKRLNWRLTGIFLLGGLQGLIGWYMVKSGLVNDPHVSHYRLTLHLMTAVLIYALLLRLFFGLWLQHNSLIYFRPLIQGLVTIGAVLLMIASGGLVAGSKAGFIFNTWPKMGERWLAYDLSWADFGLQLFNNPVLIQFLHRWLAIFVLILVVAFVWRVWRNDTRPITQWLAGLTMLVVVGQVLLGITTLILRVPIALGAAHQAGAMVLLACLVALLCCYLPDLFRREQH